MQLSSISLAITSLTGGLFTPQSLFSTGVTGTWYDPSDITTLYRDAAGTQPVTAVEQPVGLMLDKSKGLVLGSELVTNGDFSNGLTGWTSGSFSSAVLQDGGAKIERSADSVTNTALLWLAPAATAKRYRITFDVLSGSGTLLLNGSTSVTASAGKKTLIVGPGNSDTLIELRCFAGSFAVVDNISVRELPGNHAFNPSGNSANFPVLSARYNLLTKSEDFSDAVWVKAIATIIPNTAVAPNGTMTADLIYPSSTGPGRSVYQTINAGNKVSIHAKSSGFSYLWIVDKVGNAGAAWFNLSTGTKGTVAAGFSSAIEALGDGWYRCTVEAATGVFSYAQIGLSDADNSLTATTSGTSGIYIWGADLRVANDALNQPSYQRVNTATDYDTVGFLPYLRFNGTNQWLQTNSIDFSYTDKMFVSAGVRKLSDANTAAVLELSATKNSNSGVFALFAPVSPTVSSYDWFSKGTTERFAFATGYSAPITNVISGIGDISGDQAILRINGTQAAISTADQGTGNYGNYPLYLGARAGTSLWFNGRLYQLIVAGKQANTSEIVSSENFINQKTGAF